MNRTGIVQDAIFMEHVMDPGHPESPERLKVIYEMLEGEEKKSLRLIKVTPRPATREELETTHSAGYIDRIASTAGRPHFRLDLDTSTSARSFEAASLAAQRITGDEAVKLSALVDELKQTDNEARCIELDKQFHLMIAELSGNALLSGFLHAISRLFEQAVREGRKFPTTAIVFSSIGILPPFSL